MLVTDTLCVTIRNGEGLRDEQKNQGVIKVEAMKMENELKAKFDGKVKAIKVKEHQAVDKDQVLVVFE